MDTNLFVADFIFSRRFLNGNRPPYKMVYSMWKIKFNPYSKSLMVVMAEKALQPSLEIKLLQNVWSSCDRCDHGPLDQKPISISCCIIISDQSRLCTLPRCTGELISTSAVPARDIYWRQSCLHSYHSPCMKILDESLHIRVFCTFRYQSYE